mmetsp:Transcript_36699/g.117901  ORF Transcript_36699/g.117901 Transcript_36699/m.117901 type:complete len:212 (-) Transcript_36699:601-1236(-)
MEPCCQARRAHPALLLLGRAEARMGGATPRSGAQDGGRLRGRDGHGIPPGGLRRGVRASGARACQAAPLLSGGPVRLCRRGGCQDSQLRIHDGLHQRAGVAGQPTCAALSLWDRQRPRRHDEARGAAVVGRRHVFAVWSGCAAGPAAGRVLHVDAAAAAADELTAAGCHHPAGAAGARDARVPGALHRHLPHPGAVVRGRAGRADCGCRAG